MKFSATKYGFMLVMGLLITPFYVFGMAGDTIKETSSSIEALNKKLKTGGEFSMAADIKKDQAVVFIDGVKFNVINPPSSSLEVTESSLHFKREENLIVLGKLQAFSTINVKGHYIYMLGDIKGPTVAFDLGDTLFLNGAISAKRVMGITKQINNVLDDNRKARFIIDFRNAIADDKKIPLCNLVLELLKLHADANPGPG